MHALLLSAVLAVPAAFATHEEAADALADRVGTGTLLLSEGDCLAVKVFTASSYTHVAAVVVENGEPFVYDSQNGVGVRKLPLKDYLAGIRPDRLHVLRPAEPFDRRRAEQFRAYLDEQVGRPYAVEHHLTGTRCDGLHCAEYMTDALTAADLVRAERPPRVSPASLRSGLLRHGIYTEGETIEIITAEPDAPAARNWCESLWLDTKECCASCWGGFRRRVLCR